MTKITEKWDLPSIDKALGDLRKELTSRVIESGIFTKNRECFKKSDGTYSDSLHVTLRCVLEGEQDKVEIEIE